MLTHSSPASLREGLVTHFAKRTTDPTDGVKADVAWIGDRVLFDTCEGGGLYLLDPTSLVVDELVLAGHAPRPCRDLRHHLGKPGPKCHHCAEPIASSSGFVVCSCGASKIVLIPVARTPE